MRSFDDYYKFDLEYLGLLVYDTIHRMHYACDELKEEYRGCGDAMKNKGNQAAWQYIDTISAKMMETSKMIASRANDLHELLEERNRYNDRQMEQLRHLLEDEKIK